MYQRFYDAAYQRLRHNTEFAIHLAVFVTIIAAIWVAWALLLRGGIVWLPLIITGGWGAGLGAHAVSNYFNPSRRIVATEKAVQEAMSGSPQKKKKRLQQAHAILTDDGELLEIVDDPQEAQRYEHQE
jgi:hypothetical protein